ncbi:hypothetical protein DL89DRAFT_274387 [Linderina pennispora]|uniref:Cytochrome b-c1 complex subunit 2, mitochondrial n=1 Tax=Linderina pennispora TaxID=61395 RepID=A0A1Y1WGY0_9FUNG|nr:uncharacterized protein DL89DRAFT_274387 [Linderina pennispora]ORX72496.1 hypothetical protein DL89DRAFT_274387 [Linderina pennispora]
MFQTKAITKLAAPIASRTYASVASASNGIKVASVADASESPMASISLVINAGSRFETAENSGVAHYLKAFGFRNTQSRTSFRTVREAELNGASLTAEATRENIIYTVECFKDAIPYFADVLGDIATATKYTEHEFRDIAKLVAFESLSARSSPATRLVEGYAEAALTAGRVAIVGTGIDSAALAAIVSESKLAAIPASSASTLSTPASKFNGGVQQIYDSASPVSHYALAFEGASDAATTRVLANLLSGERRLKWNTGVSPLAKLAAEEGFGLQSFQSSYSDASLVGVVVSAPNAKIQEAVEKSQIASPSAETVQRAVAAAKVDVSEALATRAGKRDALAQAAFGRTAVAVESAASAAAKTFKSKPVGAAVGLSQATPYVDTLGF